MAALFAVAAAIVILPADGTRHPPELESADGKVPWKPNVVQFPTPWLTHGCGGGCWNAYLKLVPSAAGSLRAPAEYQRVGELSEIATLRLLSPSRSFSDGLSQQIVDGLAIGSLLDGLLERRLVVAVLDTRSRSNVTWKRLLFWDPAVGSFDASLLLPSGEGPFPAVVGLHGHRDDDEVFAKAYLGVRLARNGFAVLIPRFRAHDCSLTENHIARTLLGQGFTLMGLRVYETLLMHKYLEHLDAVDARRVGLLSHSGGSSTANLVVRISDSFRAHVVDYHVDYDNTCGPLKVHCETVPALVPLAAEVNDFATLAIPHLQVPYKFHGVQLRGEIVDFFRRHLTASG